MAKKSTEKSQEEKIEVQHQRYEKRRLNDAIAAWKMLSEEKQMQYLHELLETRRNELRQSYKDVTAISYGYLRKTGKDGKQKVRKQLCIGFIVKKKWVTSANTQAQKTKEIPKYLFLYANINDGGEEKRALCAIPTDVECSSDYKETKLQRLNKKIIMKGKGTTLEGMICCIVKKPIDDGKVFALGCHHVFAMSIKFKTVPNIAKLYYPITEDRNIEIGYLSNYFGYIKSAPPPPYSLDAALVEVPKSNLNILKSVVSIPDNNHVKENLVNFPSTFKIVTSRGIIKAKKVKLLIDYDGLKYAGRSKVTHEWIIESEVLGNKITHGGDSGSPVLDDQGDKLLGMHIAGVGKRAFMIPASELLRASNFGIGSQEDFLQIVAPSEL